VVEGVGRREAGEGEGGMSDGPHCAHLRVSWRTKPVEPEYPHGAMTGWWECDSGCGARFDPWPPGGALRLVARAVQAEAERLCSTKCNEGCEARIEGLNLDWAIREALNPRRAP
jgi:hypothetical protein